MSPIWAEVPAKSPLEIDIMLQDSPKILGLNAYTETIEAIGQIHNLPSVTSPSPPNIHIRTSNSSLQDAAL